MLKGIDARLSPELLRDLALTGHYDTVLLVDTNFPVLRLECPVHHLPLPTAEIMRLILELVPVETGASDAICVRSDRATEEILAIVHTFEPDFGEFVQPEPFDFLAEAVKASVAIVSSEMLPTCYLIRRGVVPPSA
jgi:L-fucose mutarotase